MDANMTSQEIRKKFLEFFKKRGHTLVPSSTVVSDDPTVLLTPAGVHQFKPYYLGKKSPYGNRVASIQKSFRTSDIAEVGDDTHNTFFEMLGNFSFLYPKGEGSYFKKEAIEWALEFFIKELGVERKRIKASVFGGDKEVPADKESVTIWKKLGFSHKEIIRQGREDNFWGPTGAEGPCGPTSELIVDRVEVWNLVFNEYYCHRDGKLTKLPAQGVDTGMGLERLAAVFQKKGFYETDLFAPIMLAVTAQVEDTDERARRILVDHLRAICFLIADGAVPSNKEQGSILRRLIRRSIVYATQGKAAPSWSMPIIGAVIKTYRDVYPEIAQQEQKIREVVAEEESRFGKTIRQGIRELENIEKRSKKTIDGADVFHLYDTFGLPVEVTQELAKEAGFSLDLVGFEQAFKEHREKSRAGAEKKFGGHGLLSGVGEIIGADDKARQRILRMHTATHLLHQALRDVLGQGVRQLGSDINAERLRFDFSYPAKLTEDQRKKVETIVNEKIKEDLPVIRKEMPKAKAEKIGALAFFKEKYGDTVSLYFVGSDDPKKAYSKEFCGGPHVKKTSEIGGFKILKEESVGAGVRRIKATVPGTI